MMEEQFSTRSTEVFWGEMAPGDHFFQLYETEKSFINTLESYIIDGLKNQESVVIIATEPRLKAIEYRLMQNGYDPAQLKESGEYSAHVAEHTLNRFMKNGWPDEELFNSTILSLLEGKGRKIRAFGEMVSLLWNQGHHGATVSLENLWQSLCEKDAIKLFCAYPKSGFTQESSKAMISICECHKKMISGINPEKTQIYFQSTGS